ncbi:MAG: glycosyltransferase family 2 protein [Candidatus Bathyarchaeota archaeon]|nr:glycosyltransferase family 2 protein [Candidatus Bathyarchaeota archaeon]
MQEKEWCPVELYHDALYKSSQPMQIILAALNEEQGIAYTITELKAYLNNPRILVVDGNSRDNTVHVAKNLGADVVFQEGTGKGDAIGLGLKCMDTNVEYIVLSDADYTYPAKHIPQMIKILEKNPRIGMVCGNRFNSEFPLTGMKGIFHIGNKLIATAHTILTGMSLNDPLTGLRVIRADLLRNWNPLSKDFDIEVELNNYIEKTGFETIEIPIAYRPRLGEKKLKMKHGLLILKRIISETLKSNNLWTEIPH